MNKLEFFYKLPVNRQAEIVLVCLSLVLETEAK